MNKEFDLQTADCVVELMKSSNTEQEWNDNADEVKKANNGDYPKFWFYAIVSSGVMRETTEKFGMDDKIRISTF